MSKQKKDIIVAVRMPRGLVEELRELQKINHFMDISDEIRYVIRKYLLAPKSQKSLDTNETKYQALEQKKTQKLIENLNQMIHTLEDKQ